MDMMELHYDQHCDGLVASFTKAAEEYTALAKTERDMAKGTN
jgi:superoxide dismutase